jgi:hypothetical protein
LHNSDQSGAERITHHVSQAVMWCGFDENLGNKARVVQGSLLLTTFARVCGKFCSETSHIAAAHGARKSIFRLTMQEQQSSNKPTKTSKPTHIQNTHLGRKKSTFPTQIFNSLLLN